MQNLFTRFVKDESGATAIEYGLIAALIAVGMIVGAKAVGTKVNTHRLSFIKSVVTCLFG